jgi:hypothetical protein
MNIGELRKKLCAGMAGTMIEERVPHFSRGLCARKPALSVPKGGDF